MPSVQRIAIIGFSAFERRTLESYFRLADSVPMYGIADSMEGCDWLLADADLPRAVQAVEQAGRVRDTIFIGGSATPVAAGGHLARPIDALALRRALDELRTRRSARQLRQSGMLPALRLVSTKVTPRVSGRVQQEALIDHEVHDFRGSSGFSNSVLDEHDLRLDEILVVSSSPAECRVLGESLMRLGYRVHITRTSDEAVALTEKISFGFVFLGLGQGGSAGFQTCRRIRRVPALGGLAPVVVAMAQKLSPIERIRATFAGCDAALSTPLDEDELMRLLSRHDRTFDRVFQPTAPMAL